MTHIKTVSSFHELVSTPLAGKVNAVCWSRQLQGDFGEVVDKLPLTSNMREVKEIDLQKLALTDAGQQAREILIQDMKLLWDNGFQPTLNVIRSYERDDENAVIKTDVYSYHVDHSPIPSDTYLCTYYGDASDILPNDQAIQKIKKSSIIEDIRLEYGGNEDGLQEYIEENFYHLHYEALPGAIPINLGLGHMWRLATKHPGMTTLPSIHRAPVEVSGRTRLLLIC